MNTNNQTSIELVINEVICEHSSEIILSPVFVASKVMDVIDPDKDSPILVALCASLQIRQSVRKILAKKFDPGEKINNEQFEMFSGLQERYPVSETSGKGYKQTPYCSNDELMSVAEMLMKKAGALKDHANALMEYVAHRSDSGVSDMKTSSAA